MTNHDVALLGFFFIDGTAEVIPVLGHQHAY